jgi:glycerol uptake facilitator-like aquaporin
MATANGKSTTLFNIGYPKDEKSFDRSDSIHTAELYELAKFTDQKKAQSNHKIDDVINKKVLRDKSPEAKAGRRLAAIRAAYGEFMCTILFYAPIYGAIVNCSIKNYDPTTTSLIVALVGGFQAIGVSFAFSSVSGAHFNSAISFALWLTGKLSNRRMIMYIVVQLVASLVAMGIIAGMFVGDLERAYIACTVTPVDNDHLDKVFSSEFFLTFILTYVAFTVAFEDAERQKKESMSFKTISDSKGLTLYASTPQSKTGFAPFSIGFTIFSLSLIGGGSGGAFNPGRMFGPAVFSGKWDYLWLYWIAQLCGSSSAALLVANMHRFGLETHIKDEVSAKDAIANIETEQISLDQLAVANPMSKDKASDSIEV